MYCDTVTTTMDKECTPTVDDCSYEHDLLRSFEPIYLEELQDSLFAGRVDTKFILPTDIREQVIALMRENYKVLTIQEKCIQHYKTLYFDSTDFKLFLDHHNGKLNRYKIRYRNYVDSNRNFIEVKFKNNKRRTKKWRREIPDVYSDTVNLSVDELDFVNTIMTGDVGRLVPTVEVKYSRIMFIHKRTNERISLDNNLIFSKGVESTCDKGLDAISIAEVKQDTLRRDSDFFSIMRRLHVLTSRFSKYCYGVHVHYPELKSNRFKKRFMKLKKLL